MENKYFYTYIVVFLIRGFIAMTFGQEIGHRFNRRCLFVFSCT